MRFRTVVFDCDSTLSRIEGVDALTERRDPSVRAKVLQRTREAMEGRCSLEEVYRQRLEWIRPTRDEVEEIGRLYAATAVDGAAQTVSILQALGKRVLVLSGGLEPAVSAFAVSLGVAREDVHAVPIQFDAAGCYQDFDSAHPLCRTGGKTEWLGGMAEALRPCCLVGDGMTDLEASSAVERFVGFGGVVVRPAVERASLHYVRGPGLTEVLEHCLDETERATARRWMDRGIP